MTHWAMTSCIKPHLEPPDHLGLSATCRPSASTNCTSQKPCSSSLALCSKPSTMTFTLLPPASLLSDTCNGWCMTDEVQDELEREQPLLGVRPWRLQFGSAQAPC